MIVFCPKNSGIALYLLPRLALTAIVHPKLCLRSSTTMIYCSALNIKAGNERRRSRHFQLILLLARPSLVIIFDRLLYFKKKYVCFAELWYASCSSISDKSFAVVWNLTWCHQIIQDENVKDYNFDKKTNKFAMKNVLKCACVISMCMCFYVLTFMPTFFLYVRLCVDKPSAWTSVCGGGAGGRWAEGRRPVAGRTAWTRTDLCPPTRGREDTPRPARRPGTGRPETHPHCHLHTAGEKTQSRS